MNSPSEIPARDLANHVIEPLTIFTGPGFKPIVLAQDPQLVEYFQAASGMIEKLGAKGMWQKGGWRLLMRGEVLCQGDSIVCDCLAIRVATTG